MVLLCPHKLILLLLILVGSSIICCGIAFDVHINQQPSLHIYKIGIFFIGAGIIGLLAQRKSKYRKLFSGAHLALGIVCFLDASLSVISVAYHEAWFCEHADFYLCSIRTAFLCTYVSGIVIAFFSTTISFGDLCCKICKNQMTSEDNDDVVAEPGEVYYSRDTEELLVNTNNEIPQIPPPSYQTVMQGCE